MYFNFFIISLCSFLLCLGACNNNRDDIDPKLVGLWSDGNVNYQFNTNQTFGLKYQRAGVGNEQVKTDSIWGKYFIDKKKSNIQFDAQYLTLKANLDSIIKRTTNLPVLNYSLQGDTLLNYSSNSVKGSLRKIK